MAERQRAQDRFTGSGCYVELDLPDGSVVTLAQDLKVGDRVYYSRAYRLISEIEDYAPPVPEDVSAAIAQLQHHARLGEMDKVAELSRQLNSTALDLHARNGDEIRLRFDSSRWPSRLRLAYGTRVAVKDNARRKPRPTGPTLTEIAQRISAHLKRFEADEQINRHSDERVSQRGLRPYFNAGASRSGRYVRVTYITYQLGLNLPREDALVYLQWLDAGNVGKHQRALREYKQSAADSADAS